MTFKIGDRVEVTGGKYVGEKGAITDVYKPRVSHNSICCVSLDNFPYPHTCTSEDLKKVKSKKYSVITSSSVKVNDLSIEAARSEARRLKNLRPDCRFFIVETEVIEEAVLTQPVVEFRKV